MKRIFLLILLVFVTGIFIFLNRGNTNTPSIVNKISPTPTIIPSQITNKILFVPYWTMQNGIADGYNEYIYFGIVPDSTGVVTSESGYQNIPSFLHAVPKNAKKFLGIRMISSTVNESILENASFEQKVIDQTEKVAESNGFDGVVLDLEYNAFPFDSIIKGISTFSKQFADTTHEHHLLFYQTVYGDTYYRGRPYDVKAIAKNTDKILVMAYDFHKANGDPGANFPLDIGSDEYSFKEMIGNFSQEVALPKLSITFGMFGYDWKIDDKGRSIGQAESLTTNQILGKFIGHCDFTNCEINQHKSLETEITYEDANGQIHDVWFEDLTSVMEKEEFVKKSGISSVAFWANGYF